MAQATFIATGPGTHFWLTPGQTATWLLIRRFTARKRSFTIQQIARETKASRGRCHSRMQRLRSLGLIGFRALRMGRNGRTFAWVPKCSAPYDLKVITKGTPAGSPLSQKAERGYFRWWASVNGRIRPKRRSMESVGDVMACLVSQLVSRNLG